MFQLWKMDLSLILSQDYIFCLEPGMVTMNKKKTWPNAALCKVVSSRKKKKQALNQEFSAVSVTIPFKTIVWNHHDQSGGALSLFPRCLRFHNQTQDSRSQPPLTLLNWVAPVQAHNSCLHSHFQFCLTRNQFWKVYVIFCQFHPSCNSRM